MQKANKSNYKVNDKVVVGQSVKSKWYEIHDLTRFFYISVIIHDHLVKIDRFKYDFIRELQVREAIRYMMCGND